VDVVIAATPENARRLRKRFQDWLRTMGAPLDLVEDLTLAVYEALANVVEHAYLPGDPHPVMRLQAQVSHDQILITISDQGCWRTPSPTTFRGRGLTMMDRLANEVHLHPTPHGTTVRLYACLYPGGDGRTAQTSPSLPDEDSS